MADHSNNAGNLKPLADAHREIDYYKRMAARVGEVRLREAEQMSRLIDRLRRTERELKAARDELERRVSERTEALSRANRALTKEIHERKRAAEELAASEKKYRAVFEDSPDAMSLTIEGRIVDVNPAWIEMHGYREKQEVIGRDVIEIVFWEDRKEILRRRDTWPWITRRGYAMRDLRKDGSIVDVEVFSSAMELKGRRAVLAILRDLTERKKAEEEKQRLEARLRHSEKMEAIGTLAGGIAHDLNNILSGLVSYPELLLLDLPESSPLRGPMTTIKKSGKKAAATVQDLLSLSRRGIAATEAVDLNQVVTEYRESPECARLKRFHPGVVFSFELQQTLLCIKGSSIHLFKAVMNLAANAAEAMPDGGTLVVRTENYYHEASAGTALPIAEGDYVLLKVADTGVGIAKSDINRIFEPFFTKKMMGRSGTGLGMAVVWGTVKDHGGHIEVESDLGNGSQFTLYFPATQHASRQKTDEKELKLLMGNGQRILVVDDLLEQREIATNILRRLGYLTEAVSNGEEALAFLKQYPVDLLMLDMIMDPGMDGLETYKRALERNPRQKAIIVSGYSQNDRVQQALSLGAGAYLKKPYLIQTIAQAVRNALKKQ